MQFAAEINLDKNQRTYTARFDMALNIDSAFNFDEDWQSYKEKLNQFFNANFLDENKKVSVFITAIGTSAYATLTEICDPVLPNTLTYEKLCEIFENQFFIFRERSMCDRLKREHNESMEHWYLRVRNIAMNSKFNDYFIGVLKDIFVNGLTERMISDSLCEEAKILLTDLVGCIVKKERVEEQSQPQPTLNHVDCTVKIEYGEENNGHNCSLPNEVKLEQAFEQSSEQENDREDRNQKFYKNEETLVNYLSEPVIAPDDVLNVPITYGQYESGSSSLLFRGSNITSTNKTKRRVRMPKKLDDYICY